MLRVEMDKASSVRRFYALRQSFRTEDHIAVEEPLEIRLGEAGTNPKFYKSVSITMRTPGRDRDLAAGFLFTEGVIPSPQSISGIYPCGTQKNTVRVELKKGTEIKLSDRHFYTTSSCGVCGKSSLQALRVGNPIATSPESGPFVLASVLYPLPHKLSMSQAVFEKTGGLHACALFSLKGEILSIAEDVGRHNALDKLVGENFLNQTLPLSVHILLLSGRASFELMQKALLAGIRIVAAVGAPSSLAVELAQEFNLTLIGFLKENRFNVYSGEWRIKEEG